MLSLPDLFSAGEKSDLPLHAKRSILIAIEARTYEFRTEEDRRRYEAIRDDVRRKLVGAGFVRAWID